MNQHSDDGDKKRVIHLFDVPHLDELQLTTALPSADHVAVMRCDSHTHVHLVLFDAHDTAVAQCVIGRPLLDMINCEAERVFNVAEQ